jgi:DNA-binding CsgD family transcriptional regulator
MESQMKSQMSPAAIAERFSPVLAQEINSFCQRHRLTKREGEVLTVLIKGVVKIKDVASHLSLSPNTVNNHINNIFAKTKTQSKSQLLAGILNSLASELQTTRARAEHLESELKASRINRGSAS